MARHKTSLLWWIRTLLFTFEGRRTLKIILGCIAITGLLLVFGGVYAQTSIMFAIMSVFSLWASFSHVAGKEGNPAARFWKWAAHHPLWIDIVGSLAGFAIGSTISPIFGGGMFFLGLVLSIQLRLKGHHYNKYH